MDEPRTTPDKPRKGAAPRPSSQRERIEEAARSRSRQLDDLEARLTAELNTLAAGLQQAAPAASVVSAAPEEFASLREELKQLQGTFAGTQQELLRQQQALASEIEQRQAELVQREQASIREELKQLQGAFAGTQQELLKQQQALASQIEQRQAELVQQEQTIRQAEASLLETRRQSQQLSADSQLSGEQLATQRERLQQLEAELAHERKTLAERIARTSVQRCKLAQVLRTQRASLKQDFDRQQVELSELEARQQTKRDQAQAELQAEREQLRRERDELKQARRELDQRVAELDRDRQALESGRTAVQEQRQQLETQRRELEQQHESLAGERKELAEAKSRTQGQRKQIAQELKAQRTSQTKEIERLREEIAETQAAQVAERQRLRQQQAEVEQRRAEWEAADQKLQKEQQKIERAAAELKQSQNAEYDELFQAAEELKERLTKAQALLKQREQQLEAAELQCMGLEEQLAKKPASSDAAAAEGEDADLQERVNNLEQRYKMALDDLREERAKAAELERKLSQAGGSAARVSVGAMDWEAQKQALLQRLSEDFDESDSEQKAEKLKIEEVIATTDRIIAEHQRELEDLRRVLSEQSQNVGSVAVGAAGLAGILDNDEIIRHERENLQTMQEEWQQKLRQAEIDISLERATIARERLELEEKLRELQSQRPADSTAAGGDDKSKSGKGSRWFKHLGLNDKG